jgi:hypothetical protein
LKTTGNGQYLDDDSSANDDLSAVGKAGRAHYEAEINLCFVIFSCLIFESSVDRGIPSFAARPSGPATFLLHSANADLALLAGVAPGLLDPKEFAAVQNHRPLNDVLQVTDISKPRI